MHVHSRYSDSFTRPSTLVKKAEKFGIGFAMTDHNEIKAFKEIKKMRPSCPVIPGIEIGVAEGPHILAYFYRYSDLQHFFERTVKPFRNKNPYMNTLLPINRLLESAEEYPCFLAAAHPEVPPYYGLSLTTNKGLTTKQQLDKVPVFEVVNGFATEKMNLHAIKSAFELGKGFIGGSDSHIPKQFGSVVTCTSAPDADTTFNEITRHESVVVGKNMRARERINPSARTVTRHLKYGGSFRDRAKSMAYHRRLKKHS